MIRNVLIMANSGLVLFSKEFSNSIAQPRMIGSLITAIIEFGQQTTGMSVSFIELTHVSIAIVSNEPVKIFCALFFDRQDGKLFGKLMASEILNAFIKDYSADFAQFGRNLKDFKGFHRKMLTVIYYSVRPVISWLELTAGIHKAIIVSDMEVIHSQKEELNDLGIISNLSPLIEMANELIIQANDFFQSLILDSEDKDKERICVWKIREKAFLICVMDKNTKHDLYVNKIEESLEILEQIYILYEDFKLTLHKSQSSS